MTASDLFRKTKKGAFVLGLASITGCVLCGCNQTDARAEADSAASKSGPIASAQSAKPADSPVETEKPSGKSEFAEDAFVAKLTPPEEVKVGKPLTFVVSLAAQGGYKVNDEYPIKFVVDETPGIEVQKETVRKDDGLVEKKRAELPVVLTITKPGKHLVGGRLSFSVCTDERCLIEKRNLLVSVTAS